MCRTFPGTTSCSHACEPRKSVLIGRVALVETRVELKFLSRDYVPVTSYVVGRPQIRPSQAAPRRGEAMDSASRTTTDIHATPAHWPNVLKTLIAKVRVLGEPKF